MAVNESRERVRSALRNSGLIFPLKRITVNLAPADLRKEGPAYDLPIAVGLLTASEQLFGGVAQAMFVGELSLDGAVRHTEGVLPMVASAREQGYDTVFVPATEAPEAALIHAMTVAPIDNLVSRPATSTASSPSRRSRPTSTSTPRTCRRTPPTSARSKARSMSSAPWRSPPRDRTMS